MLQEQLIFVVNSDKTKMIVIESLQQLQQLNHAASDNFIGKTVEPVAQVQELGSIYT